MCIDGRRGREPPGPPARITTVLSTFVARRDGRARVSWCRSCCSAVAPTAHLAPLRRQSAVAASFVPSRPHGSHPWRTAHGRGRDQAPGDFLLEAETAAAVGLFAQKFADIIVTICAHVAARPRSCTPRIAGRILAHPGRPRSPQRGRAPCGLSPVCRQTSRFGHRRLPRTLDLYRCRTIPNMRRLSQPLTPPLN
jgi:hypothetical protein